MEYVDSIKEDVKWLGAEWGDNLHFSSDYFEKLHDFAVELIQKVAIAAAPWGKINSTIGVSRLVSLDGKPKPLPSQLVSNLMLRCDVSGKVLPPKTLNAGDSIEVLKGPFTNFVATVETIDARQRVWVLMDFMGKSTRTHIAPDKVRIANLN